MISKEMSLVEIEANVRKALAECSYWGEIPLSRNEYEYMCEYMASKRKEKSITAFVDLVCSLSSRQMKKVKFALRLNVEEHFLCRVLIILIVLF